jgi:hypothetical protein
MLSLRSIMHHYTISDTTILSTNSKPLDEMELKMLRLLHTKRINRFRPQGQHAMASTRLIDVRDTKIHWDHLQKEIRTADQSHHR